MAQWQVTGHGPITETIEAEDVQIDHEGKVLSFFGRDSQKVAIVITTPGTVVQRVNGTRR